MSPARRTLLGRCDLGGYDGARNGKNDGFTENVSEDTSCKNSHSEDPEGDGRTSLIRLLNKQVVNICYLRGYVA
jgi:hypothetical protein